MSTERLLRRMRRVFLAGVCIVVSACTGSGQDRNVSKCIVDDEGAAGAIWPPPLRKTCDPNAGRGGGNGGNGGTKSDVSVASMSLGKPCGVPGAISCNGDEHCKREPDKGCAVDRAGVCTKKPDPYECSLGTVAYVCGCDDRTYGNACAADSAGVSIRHDGMCGREEYCVSLGGRVVEGADAACQPNDETIFLGATTLCCVPSSTDGRNCGKDAECGPKEYCSRLAGQSCNGDTTRGKCAAKPETCTKLYAPVCSCATVSHDNACEAARQGASLLHTAACTTADCETLGGRVANGEGSTATCRDDESEHTYVVSDESSSASKAKLCCIKKAD